MPHVDDVLKRHCLIVLRGRQMKPKQVKYFMVSFADEMYNKWGEQVDKLSKKGAFVIKRKPSYGVGSHPHPCLSPVVVFQRLARTERFWNFHLYP